MKRAGAKPPQREPLSDRELSFLRALACWCAKRDHDRTKVLRSVKKPLTKPLTETVNTVDLDSTDYRILGLE